jgi:hypothetical protein
VVHGKSAALGEVLDGTEECTLAKPGGSSDEHEAAVTVGEILESAEEGVQLRLTPAQSPRSL